MDGKIEIKRDREDFYILEVNDKGDTIQFDLTDICLPEKILNASENLAKINAKYDEDIMKIEQENYDEEQKARKIMALDKETAIKSREIFDSFLGEGACQKIFGDSNYFGMYVELFNQLEPHFDKMIIKSKKAKTRLAEKYLPKKNGVM